MKRRWLLPVCNALVDCLLVLAQVGHLNAVYFHPAVEPHRTPVVQKVRLLQEDVGMSFDLRSSTPSGAFSLIASGNLPASIIPGLLVPEANGRGRGREERIWLALHEVFAFAIWFLIGWWIDGGRRRLGSVMLAYVALRAATALSFAYKVAWADIGWRAQVLFWLAFMAWLLCLLLSRLFKFLWRAMKAR